MSDIRTVRGEGLIDFPLAAVIGVLTDIGIRHKWDRLLQSSKIIETIDAQRHIFVLYLEFKGNIYVMALFDVVGKWPTALRDMCVLTARCTEPDGTQLMCASSITHPYAFKSHIQIIVYFNSVFLMYVLAYVLQQLSAKEEICSCNN